MKTASTRPLRACFPLYSSHILAVVGYVFDWGIVNAVWDPNPAACREAFRGLLGFCSRKVASHYFLADLPYERVRPGLATLIIVGMLVVSAIPACWTRQGVRMLLWGWVAAFFAFFILMLGGVFNLEPIGTDMWGGLPLTVIITLFWHGCLVAAWYSVSDWPP